MEQDGEEAAGICGGTGGEGKKGVRRESKDR